MTLMPPGLLMNWLAVKEFSVSYYVGATLLFTILPIMVT